MTDTLILQKRKKKRKLEHLIGLDESFVTEQDAIDIIKDLEKELKKTMRSHIGADNFISPYDLFVRVIGVSPSEYSIYERAYLWNVLKKVIRHLRSTNELFIVIRSAQIFVLKDKKELEFVQNRYDQHIKALQNLKKNAEDWVRTKKWQKYQREK